jgi:hypothetical protein
MDPVGRPAPWPVRRQLTAARASLLLTTERTPGLSRRGDRLVLTLIVAALVSPSQIVIALLPTEQ